LNPFNSVVMKKYLSLILGTYAISILLTGCSDNVPYGSNPAVGKYYNIRGFKMYCETYGNGAPLLMIHGNNGSIKTFSHNIPFFEKNYKVIVADGRSQGRSVDSRDSISFEMMADDYAALLDSMHIDSAYVIGWSDGGTNALLLAMRHPGKVKKLASSGADLWPDSTDKAVITNRWQDEKVTYQKYKGTVAKNAQEKNERKFFALDWDQPNIQPAELHKIKCPALIIGGDHDMIRVKHTELIYKNIPKANLWIVSPSGHGTLFEHRHSFNNNVDAFFKTPFSPDSKYTLYSNMF